MEAILFLANQSLQKNALLNMKFYTVKKISKIYVNLYRDFLIVLMRIFIGKKKIKNKK